VIEDKLAEKLMQSARLRNILVHEYDFEEDYEKFYRSAKEYIPVFREYTETIYKYKTEENLSQ
ncbi:MAG: HepT-like ribonuclease domain-containing protein, partial [Patescibacteria group bacterium]